MNNSSKEYYILYIMPKKTGQRTEMLGKILRDQKDEQTTMRFMMDHLESLSVDNKDIHNEIDNIYKQIEDFRDNIALLKQGIDDRIEEKIGEMNTPEFVPLRFEPEPEPEPSVSVPRLSPLLESPDEGRLKSKKKTKKKKKKSKKRKSKKRKSKK